ncbi:signal peptidase I [Litoribrevibacter euphylliae]|uniref:Signal peptidase I n=1 Tax=Litoribrevibacter euphylliae TaxID=1834034 RepID=A0ABV7HBD8_9GAMM
MLYQRSPVTAGILSLIYPGLGHLYVGRFEQAVIIQAIIYGLIILLGKLGLLSTAFGAYALMAWSALLYIGVAWHSVRLAKQCDQSYAPKVYNAWWGYIGFVLVWQLGFNYLAYTNNNLLGVGATVAKTESMTPSVRRGEFLLIDTRDKQLESGDVIAFYESAEALFPLVSRVAAVGGDRISIIYGKVYLNGQLADALSVPEALRQMPYSLSMEERIVPQGQFFVLGDFRDQSQDSRFFGSVPMSNLAGRVTDIVMSSQMSRLGQSVQ